MKLKNNKFYVYLYINIELNIPFYVGKGHGRRIDNISISGRSKWFCRYINKYKYDTIKLGFNLDEYSSFELEKYWIKRIGRRDLGLGTLINMTDGGEGNSGRIDQRGENNPMYGKTFTDEHRKKISDGLKGKLAGDKHFNWGKKLSKDTIDKIRIGNIGNKVSDETKKKLSYQNTGVKNSKHINKTTGLPCYISYSRSKIKPYMVRINNKYLGIFETIDMANDFILHYKKNNRIIL